MRLSRRAAALALPALTFAGGVRAAEMSRFPFRVTRNRVWTPVSVNGKDPPLPFMVDTGANGYGITPAAAQQLGLPVVTRGGVQTAAGRLNIQVYRAERLLIGGAIRESNVFLAAMPRPLPERLQGLVPTMQVGAMGFDFDAQMAMIGRFAEGVESYDRLPMSISDPHLRTANDMERYLGGGEASGNFDLRPVVDAELDGEPVKLMLDTGAPGGLHLLSDYVKSRGLWDKYPKAAPIRAASAARTVDARVVRSERLKLGRFVFNAPITTLQSPEEADQDGSKPYAGLIGMELLRRLNFVSDFRKLALFIRPSQAMSDGYRYDRAGMDVRPVEGELRVVYLVPGSPAARAGVWMGDKVTGWRGSDGVDGLLWALQGAPGSKVDIQVEREGKPQLVSVTLEERI